jgi:hypothetical protein
VASVLGLAFLLKISEVRESEPGVLRAGQSACLCGAVVVPEATPSIYCHTHCVYLSDVKRAAHNFCPAIKTAFGDDIDIDAYSLRYLVVRKGKG